MKIASMKHLVLACLALVSMTCVRPAVAEPAPEFERLDGWLNSRPLSLADLKGKVVLIDFWTYSCINCVRTLPTLVKWHEAYKDKGLVVLGVHTPEFAFERDPRNVERATKRFGIEYPVAQDNAYATWRAYGVRYWPTTVLIDKNGEIALTHAGEGDYDNIEREIAKLVAASPAKATPAEADLSRVATAEIYLGLTRLDRFASPEAPSNGPQTYSTPDTLPANTFALEGAWQLGPENATLTSDGGSIALRFNAAKAHFVASSPEPIKLDIEVDGRPQPSITIHDSRLYTLFDGDEYREHVLKIRVPKAGLQAFTFSFG